MIRDIKRCDWASEHDLNKIYHDEIWGRPMHDDLELFKMLCLEGMQAGLSWLTILKKFDSMCKAFDNFDPNILVKYEDDKINELLMNPGIIRNKLKVKSVITNAKCYFEVVEEFGSFSNYIWSFVDNQPIINNWKSMDEVPASTELSDKMSKDLKKRGFKFIGTTIIYAFMQATGMVNDHLVDCDIRKEMKLRRGE